MPCTFSWLANLYFHFRPNKSIWRLSFITWDQITCKVKDLSTAFCETQPPASFGWVALSSVFVCRPASVTSPPISTIWCFRAYKLYIFCEDMILATCQCQHIFCCWVEPSLLLSSLNYVVSLSDCVDLASASIVCWFSVFSILVLDFKLTCLANQVHIKFKHQQRFS